MPEIGFELEPISPVRRDETVTKRKPKSDDQERAENIPLQVQLRHGS